MTDALVRGPDDLTLDESLGDPLMGETLDRRFRIQSLLGAGGMATVYRGIQLSLDRPVAIKVIRTELLEDPGIVQRFVREVRLLTSVNHPNVVSLYDVGHTASGALYIAMELLRGATLDAELMRAGPFTPQRTCAIAVQLCEALAATHAHGIVHRDLKPANVMLLDGPALHDIVKVLDFGLATADAGDRPAPRLTVAGMVLGTPRYMAPETIASAGAVANAKSDLYSLGCILYELVAGRPPFTDPLLPVVLARHLRDPPPLLPPAVPLPIARFVITLLAKDPAQRPALDEARRWVRELVETHAAPDPDDVETLVGSRRADPPRVLPKTPLLQAPRAWPASALPRVVAPALPWPLIAALAAVLVGIGLLLAVR